MGRCANPARRSLGASFILFFPQQWLSAWPPACL